MFIDVHEVERLIKAAATKDPAVAKMAREFWTMVQGAPHDPIVRDFVKALADLAADRQDGNAVSLIVRRCDRRWQDDANSRRLDASGQEAQQDRIRERSEASQADQALFGGGGVFGKE